MLAVGALGGEAGEQWMPNFSNRAGFPSPYGYVTAAGNDVLGYDLGSSQVRWPGTSMAAPYVSSLAAILLSANPSLSATQVVDVISQTSHQLLM